MLWKEGRDGGFLSVCLSGRLSPVWLIHIAVLGCWIVLYRLEGADERGSILKIRIGLLTWMNEWMNVHASFHVWLGCGWKTDWRMNKKCMYVWCASKEWEGVIRYWYDIKILKHFAAYLVVPWNMFLVLLLETNKVLCKHVGANFTSHKSLYVVGNICNKYLCQAVANV